MQIRVNWRDGFATLGYAIVVTFALVAPAAAADAVLQTDFLSRLDPALVGALSGLAGGTIRAMRSDVPTKRAIAVDAVPGALAGGFAWPVTLSIFGPVLATLQTTADVVLTIGAKVGVAGLMTGVCLSLFIGFAEAVFNRASAKGSE